jgi:hypothetical protein
MKSKFKVINIEAGMPTVEVGRKRLYLEIVTARNQGIHFLKVIHSYGSTGVGGRLKRGILEYLALKKKEGFIKSFVPGEDWSIFNQAARDIMEQCDDLRKDSDLGNCNLGITIVTIKYF